MSRAWVKIAVPAFLICFGFFLRIAPELGRTGEYTPTETALTSLEMGLSTSVLDFYNELNVGDFGRAFNRAVEVSWLKDMYLDTNKNVDHNTAIGFTSKKTIIERSKEELGEAGEKLSIFDVRVVQVRELVNGPDQSLYQDIVLLDRINELRQIERSYVVTIEGQIYWSFCSHSRWQKRLILVTFSGTKDTAILLNGSKNLVGARSLEWFVDRIVGEYLL